jgi:hypothetical protein
MSPHTFPYDLLYICPALRPRLRCSCSLVACPRSLQFCRMLKPHTIIPISRLNNTAFVLAVYASQILSPRPMQDSLPVTCSVFLCEIHGFPWFPLGHYERFLLYPPSMSFVSQRQSGYMQFARILFFIILYSFLLHIH